MSSSLLIKGLDGDVIGYALASGGQLCIRISGQGTQGTARISDGETEISVQVNCSGTEQTFRWNGNKGIEWLRIEYAGKIIANGGNVPETVFRNGATGLAVDDGEHENMQMQACSAKKEKTMSGRAGQRRWPPPPCWPSARYLDGEWEEDEDGL